MHIIQEEMPFHTETSKSGNQITRGNFVSEISVDSYDFKKFVLEDYKELNEQLESGQKILNVHATSLLFSVMSKILK